MNITYQTKYDILEIEPTGPLEKEDFDTLSEQLDNAVKKGDRFNGLLIKTRKFPGYQKFSDMVAHGEFLSSHRDQVEKVAVCTDSTVGPLLQMIGKSLTRAEVKRFPFSNVDEAQKWLLN